MVEQLSKREAQPNREIVLDPERHAVVRNLVDMHGNSIGSGIVGDLLSARRDAHIIGPPGTGKSTLLFQLRDAAQSNAQLLGIPYSVDNVAYEEELEQAEDDWGNREDWDRRRWTRDFNRGRFIPAIQRASTNAPLAKVHSTFVEYPGVGNNKVRDRGKTAFLYSARRAQRMQPESAKPLFIYLVGDPSLQKTSAILRGLVSQSSPEDIFQILNDFHIDVSTLPNTREVGIHIKNVFSHMANSEHIKTINSEILEETTEWTYKNPDYKRFTSRVVLPPNFGKDIGIFFKNETGDVKESIEKSINLYRQKAQLEAGYMDYLMHEELQLDETTGVVAFNPPLVGVKILNRFGI